MLYLENAIPTRFHCRCSSIEGSRISASPENTRERFPHRLSPCPTRTLLVDFTAHQAALLQREIPSPFLRYGIAHPIGVRENNVTFADARAG